VTVALAGPAKAPARPRPAVRAADWMPAVAGVVLLVARPWFLPPGVDVSWRVGFFVALGLAGAAWPVAAARRSGAGMSAAVLGLGVVTFAAGRAAMEVPIHSRGLVLAVALNALAAVAEEAFFRRYVYGLLTVSFGSGTAVVATAAAFAAVHVTVWGWWVLPLDLAAGLILSWQRAATGRWSVSAATHVLANTLALL
jgi:membrane protease YdiL (CAAX protease family)